MAKELPYFKFYISEWVNGDITLEDYELQGIFINICTYYWSKDCELSMTNLKKKFRGIDEQIKSLIDANILKVVNQNLSISFLNEQLKSKEIQKITNKINGQQGGRPKKIKTEEKPNGFLEETESKPKDNPEITNIEESKEDKKITSTPVEKTVEVDFNKFIKGFNSFASRSFKINDKVKTALKARLKDNSKEEIMKAIKNAHNDQFHIKNRFKYLTPEYILRADKLDLYINMPNTEETNKQEELWQAP